MSKIRFYTDEHIARAGVRGLRQLGVDVLTIPEGGLMGVPDVEHLGFALPGQRVIVTQDDPGRDRPVGTIIRGRMPIVPVLKAAELQDRIEFLP